jgi:primosomal protein N' (replication factor Y)
MQLVPGSLVQIQLQNELILGFVDREVSRPVFKTKPVSRAYDLPPLPQQLPKLAEWLRQFYGSTVGAVSQLLLPPLLIDKAMANIQPVVAYATIIDLPSLTDEQADVVKNIVPADTYLLHGRTGTGKTRVYLELAQRATSQGKSAIILTPEISLTSQLAKTFQAVFGSQVVLLHSQLTPAERQRAWLQILSTSVRQSADVDSAKPTPLVVIGPRSALFSPLANVGLIVIDEAHETAYKQEQAPYYQAVRVGSQLAHLHDATLIIGSATPSIADYYLAQQRGKRILTMQSLAVPSSHAATQLNVVDLKDRSLFSRSKQLSTPLVEAMQASLGRGEQSLVYLNRRGTARVVLCENCGWQALCPHCDLPLIYHADTGEFRCHTCGFHTPIVTSCPACGYPSVLFKSFGTKAAYEEVRRLFPEARVARFDTDNKRSERFENHYDDVRDGKVDILVGTQLLAKGLDLPHLSTLGILLADSSLYVPDFSATERSYQLLSQVLGRVGRGHVAGHAVIQTYHPESPILDAAVTGNWDEFYETELSARQKFHFPPFYHLLKLSCRRASAKSAEAAAQKVKQELAAKVPGITIDGPAPSFHEKLQGKYQYQLVVKATDRSKLLVSIRLLPKSGWTYDIDPMNLL